MLIDEMLAVGDHKELPFLLELESHQNPKIRNRAFVVKTALQQKLGVNSERERRRIPMNLCFIYDEFDIRPSKPDSDLEFELALEVLEK